MILSTTIAIQRGRRAVSRAATMIESNYGTVINIETIRGDISERGVYVVWFRASRAWLSEIEKSLHNDFEAEIDQ